MQTISDKAIRSRRSKGCLGCRKSKVKCSEEQPRCRRCARQGSQCHYPDPLDIDFRNENNKAAVRAESLWRQRVTVPNLLKAPSPGPDDLQHRALAAFYRDFGCTAEVSTPWIEFFQMLPNLYRRAAGNPSSAQAIRALALAHYARQQQQISQLEILARTEYSKALNLIRSQLQKRKGVPCTDVIVSVSLMGLFETILPSSSSAGTDHRSWQAHQHGAISMIQQQAESHATDASAVEPRLLRFMYLLMIVNCVNNRSRPLLPLHLWTGVVDSRLPAARLFRMMYSLAQWQADIDGWIEEGQRSEHSNSNVDYVQDMTTRLSLADAELQEWEAQLPPTFHFYERPSTPADHVMLQWPGAPRRIYVYESCWRAIPRTFCFAVRILLSQNLLRCYRWVLERGPRSGMLKEYQAAAVQTIVEMIAHISRSVDAVVGSSGLSAGDGRNMGEGEAMRGLAIVWPLSAASSALLRNRGVLDRVGDERARWVEDALLYVRRLVGNREPTE
ncbi:Zn(II)2Cys6 transcription factor [Aspergillus homomorphus CBS 101889]|uniref:Zn(2)-C6 fungal-type domain-containing protein n=1 Tax=Aspergillus homomorphus (strain CBS 101889) TaxID=1450537 RepID=A0A395HYR5_ASPHC|nr:hypothetical protein BO97DRAFT_477366 [Aspergillus homomorphus CBS 101889]RAL13082.1 hypothetical protein BO97DRAFT_477366 [Aspergillus homomorphus CBS 101889]